MEGMMWCWERGVKLGGEGVPSNLVHYHMCFLSLPYPPLPFPFLPLPFPSLSFQPPSFPFFPSLQSGSLLKFATRAVGEVINLSWTSHGLTVCYNNTSVRNPWRAIIILHLSSVFSCSHPHTQTLCLLPPSPGDYLGERCIHSCLPTLHFHNITDPSKAPCLTALLKNLHHMLLDQYRYEEVGASYDSHVTYNYPHW